MSCITITSVQRSSAYDYRVDISTGETFTFNSEDAEELTAPPREGDEVTEQLYDLLTQADSYYKCARRAVYLLSFSAMSKRKLYDKLVKAAFDKQTAMAIADRFEQKRMIDDFDFALTKAQWMKEGKNYGPQRIKSDLISNYRIPVETVKEVLEDESLADYSENLAAMIRRKFNRSALMDKDARNKAVDALRRNGYAYDEIKRALLSFINGKD